jgi:tetratricopeptide (TPR) repeat protein
MFLSQTVFSQAEFKIKIDDYLWIKSDNKTKIKILIFIKIKNIGNRMGICTDMDYLYLDCTNSNYKYGRDIILSELSDNSKKNIFPKDSIYSSITFELPKNAENLTLKFTQENGGAQKYLNEGFDKWIKNNKDEKVFINKADKYFNSGDYVNCIINCHKALIINSNSKVSFQLGNAWLMIGNYDYAIEYYNNSLDEGTDKSLVYNNIGYAYIEKEYYKTAIENFLKAIKYDSKHFDAMIGLSISYFQIYDVINAKYYYNNAAEIENKLYKGMDGLYELIGKGYFYTEKQIIVINNICKYCGYIYYKF